MSAVRKPLPKPPDPLERWNLLGVSDLSQLLPPIPWVCEPLGLAPGAVSLVAGYGYSRKTMALQSLGLSVAAGRPVWGLWSCRKGPFVHLDYEQGRRVTQERYQRLARGMGFALSELPEGALRVACMPRAYLDEDGIFEQLVALVGDAALVLVDSLRAAFPHADENSSEVRTYLDVLSRVSERTGAAIAVIHHARKPNVMNGGGATHAIRGSSALFDACQSVYVFEGEKDTPTKVHHQKDRVRGVTLPEFGLTSDDLPGATGPRDGLAVRHLDVEQMAQAGSQRSDAREDAAIDAVSVKIRETFAKHGGRIQGSRVQVRSLVRAHHVHFDAAWTKLVSAGTLNRMGPHREPAWALSESPNPQTPNPSPIDPQTPSGIDPQSPHPFRGGDRSHDPIHTDPSPGGPSPEELPEDPFGLGLNPFGDLDGDE